MDELLSIATKAMENFNPATDTVDNFEKLPDGEYSCLLEDVAHRKSEKGTEWISFRFSVMEGEYTNRLIFVNYFFTEKTAERSVKSILKLAYEFGYEISLDTFNSFDILVDALNSIAGNKAIVKQTTSKNDFANYKVTPVA